jgi:hypothetical protein
MAHEESYFWIDKSITDGIRCGVSWSDGTYIRNWHKNAIEPTPERLAQMPEEMAIVDQLEIDIVTLIMEYEEMLRECL